VGRVDGWEGRKGNGERRGGITTVDKKEESTGGAPVPSPLFPSSSLSSPLFPSSPSPVPSSSLVSSSSSPVPSSSLVSSSSPVPSSSCSSCRPRPSSLPVPSSSWSFRTRRFVLVVRCHTHCHCWWCGQNKNERIKEKGWAHLHPYDSRYSATSSSFGGGPPVSRWLRGHSRCRSSSFIGPSISMALGVGAVLGAVVRGWFVVVENQQTRHVRRQMGRVHHVDSD
jgi:hypothetical protein